jgi:hypothetical protein
MSGLIRLCQVRSDFITRIKLRHIMNYEVRVGQIRTG